MYSVNFSNKAVEDLSNIWNYSAKRWSVRQANVKSRNILFFIKSKRIVFLQSESCIKEWISKTLLFK